MSELTVMPHGTARQARPGRRLILADTVVAIVDRWRSELAVLRQRAPDSDVAVTLAACVQDIGDAIASTDDLQIQLTLAEAHVMSHIPMSTLRWLCHHRSEQIGARKSRGVWYVGRRQFEQYLAATDAPRRAVNAHRPTNDSTSIEPEDAA
jgi:hypothetical protein